MKDLKKESLQEHGVVELDVFRIIRRMWHRAWAVFLVMCICGGIGFSIAAFGMAPEYQSKAMLYVNNNTISVGNTSVNMSDLTASQSLVKTYIVILKTRRTLEAVIREADLNYTYNELMDMIDAYSENNTEIFNIRVTSYDPKEAAMIANTIVNVLPDKIAEVVDGSSVRTVDFAVVPTRRSGPSVTMFTAVGLLFGFCISLLFHIVKEYKDDVIHDKETLLRVWDLPVLAVVPDLYARQEPGYYSNSGRTVKHKRFRK